MRPLLFSFALMALASPSNAVDACPPRLDFWRDNVTKGTRAFHVVPFTGERAGAGGYVVCMSKGFASETEMLDPVVSSHYDIGSFFQLSHMPCAVMKDELDAEVVLHEANDTALTNDARRLLLSSAADDACAAASSFDSDTCEYPASSSHGQYTWGGVSFKISMVNDNHTTPDGFEHSTVAYEAGATGVKNELQHVWTHAPVFGGAETSCAEQGEDGTFLYSSGVAVENAPLPYDMKYKVYMFASDEERLAALEDERNAGLEYAREMKGANGCDAEIVYEFFPKPGGGLMVELSQIAMCTTEEGDDECAAKRRAVTDTTSAYVVNDTVVVQVNQSSLRDAQYLPVRPVCDLGMTPTIKMSSQFICAATGERINITSITMSRTTTNDKVTSEISRDPANPTTFQVDPENPSTCYWDPSCRDGNLHDVDIRLEADATAAPESCGSFYWDPLLQAVPGDGFAWELATDSGHGTTVDSAAATTPSFFAALPIALAIVAPLRRG